MRLLVDSCVARAVVYALRHAGFNVEWVTDWASDPGDRIVLQHAFETGRVLVTRDKDFGELIFRDGRPHCGVVRLSGEMKYAEQARQVLQVLADHADDLQKSALVTVETDRIRVSRGVGGD